MLRLQNKYRNTLKKEPERIAALAAEMGLEAREYCKNNRFSGQEVRLPDRDTLRRKLENEINALYDRLTQALKAENERLRLENMHLREENEHLKRC
jgi:hypothetical protein